MLPGLTDAISTVVESRSTVTATDPLSRAVVSLVLQAFKSKFPTVPAVADAVNVMLGLLDAPGACLTESDAGVQPDPMAVPVHVRVYLIVLVSTPVFVTVKVLDDNALGSALSVEYSGVTDTRANGVGGGGLVTVTVAVAAISPTSSSTVKVNVPVPGVLPVAYLTVTSLDEFALMTTLDGPLSETTAPVFV